jgi:proteasome lid subunit RPN8/RPN11
VVALQEVKMGRAAYLYMLDCCLRVGAIGEEACGLIVMERRGPDEWFMATVPSINVAEDREHEFCVDPDVQREYAMREGCYIAGTWHSHPKTGAVPSELDRGMYLGLRDALGDAVHLIVSLKGGQPVVRAWRAHSAGVVQIAFEVVGIGGGLVRDA